MSKVITLLLPVISICVSTFDALAKNEQSPSFNQSAYVFYVRLAELTVPEPRISGKDNVIRNGKDRDDSLYAVMLRNEYNQKWLTISDDGKIKATADNANGAGRFVIWKTTEEKPENPHSTDKRLHNGDYCEIRTTKGNTWIEIEGDNILLRSTDSENADELFLNKVTPPDPKNPQSTADTIHDGDYIVIRGKTNLSQGDPWLHLAGTELVARGIETQTSPTGSDDSALLKVFDFPGLCSRLHNGLPQFRSKRFYIYAHAPNIQLIGNEVQQCTTQSLAACVGATIASIEQCLPAAETYLIGCLTAKVENIQEMIAKLDVRLERGGCNW